MKKIIIGICFMLTIKVFSQSEISELENNHLYLDSTVYDEQIDSIDNVNNYPRVDAIHYIIGHFTDTSLNKYDIVIDKVTRKWLKKYILDTLRLPTIRIPYDSLSADTTLIKLVNKEIRNHQWNPYKHGNSIWMFNFDTIKAIRYGTGHLNDLNDIGGKLWNFPVFLYINYSQMDNDIDGFTVRQICNSMNQILKLKINNRIVVRMYRKNGNYVNWDDVNNLIDNGFTLIAYNNLLDQLLVYDICEVANVDVDVTGCAPITDL